MLEALYEAFFYLKTKISLVILNFLENSKGEGFRLHDEIKLIHSKNELFDLRCKIQLLEKDLASNNNVIPMPPLNLDLKASLSEGLLPHEQLPDTLTNEQLLS